MTDVPFDPELMRAYLLASERSERCRRALEEDALRRSGWATGDLAEDRETGLLYRIQTARAFADNGEVRVSLHGYRVYKSGRRDARSASWLAGRNLKKVVDKAASGE